jgi:hypothetical protein
MLDHQQVVRVPVSRDVLRGVVLGVRGVGGDHCPGQVHGIQ